jgi:hypothetical protein
MKERGAALLAAAKAVQSEVYKYRAGVRDESNYDPVEETHSTCCTHLRARLPCSLSMLSDPVDRLTGSAPVDLPLLSMPLQIECGRSAL